MTSSAVLCFADVDSETVAGIWAKVYSNLRNGEVVRGTLVCKSFKSVLSPLVRFFDSHCSGPPFTQQSFENLARNYRNLECFSIEQKYDAKLETLD